MNSRHVQEPQGRECSVTKSGSAGGRYDECWRASTSVDKWSVSVSWWRCQTMQAPENARTHNRYWILSGTLSQWSSRRSGVVCSDLLIENTSRAAAFSTDWSRCISDPYTPANTKQQKSSFVMTSERISVSKASYVSQRRTLRICRSAEKQTLIVAVTWADMVTSASM